jgi:hypothetical protein
VRRAAAAMDEFAILIGGMSLAISALLENAGGMNKA